MKRISILALSSACAALLLLGAASPTRFHQALSALPDAGGRVTIGPSSLGYAINTAEIVPATVDVDVQPGGRFVKSGAGTLAINGGFNASLTTVFSGFAAGDVTFGAGRSLEVYPQWWGAVGDGVHDDTVAIQSAIDSVQAIHGTVRFPPGTYLVSAPIVPGYVGLVGSALGTNIQAAASMTNTTVVWASKGRMDLLTIDGVSADAGNVCLHADSTHNPYGSTWGKLNINNCDIGFLIDETGAGGIYYNNFGNMRIELVHTGMKIDFSQGAETQANADTFDSLFVEDFTVVALQVVAAVGWGIGFFEAEPVESGAIALDIQSCADFIIHSGYIEMHSPADTAIKLTSPWARHFEYHGTLGVGLIDEITSVDHYNVLPFPSSWGTYGTRVRGGLYVPTLIFEDNTTQTTAGPPHYALVGPTAEQIQTYSTAVPGGGHLPPGTYYYRATACNSGGCTLASNEPLIGVTVPDVDGGYGVNVNFADSTGATSYQIFGRTTGAAAYLHTIPGTASTQWTDDGTLTPGSMAADGGTPPPIPDHNATADYALGGRMTAALFATPGDAGGVIPGATGTLICDAGTPRFAGGLFVGCQ